MINVEGNVKKYIADKHLYSYKEGDKEMVEFHVDDWYSYNKDKDKDLPPI